MQKARAKGGGRTLTGPPGAKYRLGPRAQSKAGLNGSRVVPKANNTKVHKAKVVRQMPALRMDRKVALPRNLRLRTLSSANSKAAESIGQSALSSKVFRSVRRASIDQTIWRTSPAFRLVRAFIR